MGSEMCIRDSNKVGRYERVQFNWQLFRFLLFDREMGVSAKSRFNRIEKVFWLMCLEMKVLSIGN